MVSRICIVGLGYIGLPTAAVFADAGIAVTGVDVNADAVRRINAGEPHIVEAGLGEMLARVVGAGLLRATTAPEPAEAFIVAVPTPFQGDHAPDLSYIEAASRAIAPRLAPGNLVILESTSPVGATERMAAWMAEARPDLRFPGKAGEAADIHIAHCPERVLPGRILQEVVENDRVVGGLTPACAAAAADLYRLVVRGECFLTDARTAEMTKLTENAFRDVNIAFANELSLLCDRFGIDVWTLIEFANKHPRVNILRPGAGVGGHCIAVDPWFIVDAAPDLARLIHTARRVNDAKPEWVVERVRAMLAGTPDPVIACFGLAFKPDIDDLRESPAVAVTRLLAGAGIGTVCAVEPFVSTLPEELSQVGVTLVDADTALAQADLSVFLVGHSAFRTLEPGRLDGQRVLDVCGVWR